MATKAGSYTGDRAGVLNDTAQNVTNKMADAASAAKQKISDAGSQATDKIDEKRGAAADALENTASNIHEKAQKTPWR
jgi:hypothetical protein